MACLCFGCVAKFIHHSITKQPSNINLMSTLALYTLNKQANSLHRSETFAMVRVADWPSHKTTRSVLTTISTRYNFTSYSLTLKLTTTWFILYWTCLNLLSNEERHLITVATSTRCFYSLRACR